ncbi:hypothetical protein ACOMHN_040663 [Nucella lapillus]
MLQLAPTMYHQTEAMLAFLKEFKWHDFTMVTTSVTGSEDFFAYLRSQVQTSNSQALPNKYGHTGFQFKVLSAIKLRSGSDKKEVQTQLKEDIDPDTRIILLHSSSREALEIVEVAKEMGLTGREYVWILSASAMGDKTAGDTAAASLPLGLFGVRYNSGLEHMTAVIRRGIRVWLEAIQNLQKDQRLAQWNWQTKLSCEDGRLKKWIGGDLLYEYLRNVTLPAEDSADVPTSFNDTGLVRVNKLSILNVMPKTASAPGRAKPSRGGFLSGKKPSFGRGSSGRSPFGRGGSKGSLFGGGSSGSRSPFGRGSSGSSFGSKDPKRLPGSGSSSSGGSLSPGGSSSGGLSPGESKLSAKFGSPSRGSSSPFNRGNRRFPSRTNSSSGRLFGSSSNRLSGSSTSTPSPSLLLSNDVISGGLHPSSGSRSGSWRDRANYRSSRFKSRSYPYRSGGSRYGEGVSGGMGEGSAAEARSILADLNKTFQEVATWDGKELKVVGIVWPGNSSVPPKGVPETYHLNVVTYIEEPHVTSLPLGDKAACGLHATRCLAYERDENDNRLKGQPPVEQCCTGLSIDILSRLSKELNFNFTLFEIDSPGYGSQVESKNNSAEWTGLVGTVLKRDADVAVAALAITPEREEAIDFSVPFLETGITIVVAIREGAISPTAFLEPYDYPSWTLILVFSVHATGASIFIFEWLSPYGLDQGHTPLRGK